VPEPVEELTAATEEPVRPSIAAAHVISKCRAWHFTTGDQTDISPGDLDRFHLCNLPCSGARRGSHVLPITTNVHTTARFGIGWFTSQFLRLTRSPRLGKSRPSDDGSGPCSRLCWAMRARAQGMRAGMGTARRIPRLRGIEGRPRLCRFVPADTASREPTQRGRQPARAQDPPVRRVRRLAPLQYVPYPTLSFRHSPRPVPADSLQ
jgi:hypothetical protein